METSRSSPASRSSWETSSALRQTGGSGCPKILCSGITRPSSRMKSRHTSPHLTSLRIRVSKPQRDLDVIIWPSSGGQLAPVPTCFAVDSICWHPGGELALIALFWFGLAADDLRSLCRWSRPEAARQDTRHGLLHH